MALTPTQAKASANRVPGLEKMIDHEIKERYALGAKMAIANLGTIDDVTERELEKIYRDAGWQVTWTVVGGKHHIVLREPQPSPAVIAPPPQDATDPR